MICETTTTATETGAKTACTHCGLACPDTSIRSEDRVFCCTGCRTVYDILAGAGLVRFYALGQTPGLRPRPDQPAGHFSFLRDPAVSRALLDFENGRTARVTFHIPGIHCAACVWLLENLHRIAPGMGTSTVDFPARSVTLDFDPREIGLDRVAETLASLGYAPQLNLATLGKPARPRANRALWMRMGVAGFAAGNIMMMSIATYLGLEADTPGLGVFFRWLSLALSLPVLFFSASGYFHSAWNSLRYRVPSIDVPVAIGLVALFGLSAWEIAADLGEGYLDSFAGLVFLLLAGKVFQSKTHASLSFERDYTAYFPLSVTREVAAADDASPASRLPAGTRPAEQVIPITQLKVGDTVVVRDQELIPADAELLSGRAWIDYSFVTGESDPVARAEGELVYAGGRQVGGAIRLKVNRQVSQSYLTSLWNRDAFHKPDPQSVSVLVDRVSRWFAPAILVISAALGFYWYGQAGAEQAVRVFAATLIIACPCALAMAAPYAFGSASRILGRHGFYLRNANVVERLARVDAVALDKTGTLTAPGAMGIETEGRDLTAAERAAVATVASASTHPLSRRLSRQWGGSARREPESFEEITSQGIRGRCGGITVQVGRAEWLESNGIRVPAPANRTEARAAVAIDGRFACWCWFPVAHRPGLSALVDGLRSLGAKMALLTGDDPRAETGWRGVFGTFAQLRFGQDPHDKLAFVQNWQREGHGVLMAGDGLNDAGALRQADVGVAVTDDVTSFSPACDGILDARRLDQLPLFIRFARHSVLILRACFVVSFLYNAFGITLAARGLVSPLLSAILMPLSSFSAILLALLGVRFAAARLGLRSAVESPETQPQPTPAAAPAPVGI